MWFWTSPHAVGAQRHKGNVTHQRAAPAYNLAARVPSGLRTSRNDTARRLAGVLYFTEIRCFLLEEWRASVRFSAKRGPGDALGFAPRVPSRALLRRPLMNGTLEFN